MNIDLMTPPDGEMHHTPISCVVDYMFKMQERAVKAEFFIVQLMNSDFLDFHLNGRQKCRDFITELLEKEGETHD